ncbi:MAG: hypothetical protein IJ860_07805 [Eubacterium sp.]|nr:hypothetical protein [Eubacterium sp.]
MRSSGIRRFTRKNAINGAYWMPMDYVGEFRTVGDQGRYTAYGDLVDKLGKCEDFLELLEKHIYDLPQEVRDRYFEISK